MNPTASAPLHGIMAEFAHPNAVINAARRAHADGYRHMDAYTPLPIDGLAETLGQRQNPLPLIVLIGGTCGGIGGYLLQWYTLAIDYPLNVGGRPFHSWPAFIPITFEMTVLCAALAGVIGLFALNRLPQPYHPVFNVPAFSRASTDRFFLCIEASDPKFNPSTTRRFLQSLSPISVNDVAL